MRLTYNEKEACFTAITTFAEKDIAKDAGMRWNGTLKQWTTTNLIVSNKLAEFADEATLQKIACLKEKHLQAILKSSATNADIDIPCPAGLAYLPYQKAGIAYALERIATLLGDEMGLGKTIISIGIINAKGVKKILIVCPASLKINWSRELEKWLVNKNLTIGIADKKFPDTDVVIVNYDLLKKYETQIKRQNWEMVIADEAHYVKNRKAKRSILLSEITAQISQRLLLTGTPIANRPEELFQLLHILDPNRWNKFFTFAMRYCDAKNNGYGWDYSGSSNMRELQSILRETLMVRRLKKDVLTELPPKIRQVIEIQAEGDAAKLIKQSADGVARIEELRKTEKKLKASKASMDKADYDKAIEELEAKFSATFEELATLRHETALAKVPDVIEHCRSVLEETNKIVVFAHHKDVIDKIKVALAEFNPVIVIGDMDNDARQVSVDNFQQDQSVRVFVGTIDAAGVGLTLTAGSTVIFAELSWVPGKITQAEDRCHRIGQHDSVLIQHIVLNGSVEAHIAKIVVEKQTVIDEVLD